MNGKKPASLSNLRVYLEKDKKWYDLQEFKILGEKFIRQIAQAFISYAETRRFETYTKVFYSIKVWLNWMVDNQDQHKDFFTQLKKDHLELVLNGQDEWELVLGYYRSHLVNRTGVEPRTKHNYISQLNTFLEHLVANSVVPFVEPLDNIRFMSNSKKSVAEVNRNGTIPVEKLRKIVLDSGVGDEDIELTIDLLISLSEEGVDVENLNEVRDGTLQIINDRLNTIRDAAEKDVISEYRVFREGQKFIESCDMEGAEVASKLETLWLNTAVKNNFYSCGKKLKKLFPHNEIGKSRVLKYIEYRYNGLVPGKWYNCELTPFDDGRFFDETILKRKCGWTKEQARRRLHAGPRLLSSRSSLI